jgi:colanic acid biosynthesis glycosyl transferase WcaI
MSEPSPILFVTRYFWPELIGSAPFTSDVAEWLAKEGRQITVLSGLPHYPGTTVFPAYQGGRLQHEKMGTVVVERVSSGPPQRASALSRILNEAGFLMRGLGALASGRIKRHPVVLALCPSILCVVLALVTRQRGGSAIAIVHDIQSGLAEQLGLNGGALARLMRWVEQVTLNRVDLVVVLSQEMKDQLRRIGVSAPIDVVPLWVDTDEIQPVEPTVRPAIKVLYSGNLGRKQGLGQVVEMAEQLARCRPEIEIVLRGNGNQAHELIADIARRRLENVHLAELQPNDSLSTALAAGDIHLVPQNPQAAAFAVPSKVYNIMAVGRPFVATALPDSTLWHLAKQSGAFLCVPPNEPLSFTEAVLKLADDPQLRLELGRRGRAFVEQHYAKPLILSAFSSRLDALVAGH